MPVFEYKCDVCYQTLELPIRQEQFTCPDCSTGTMKRSFSFAIKSSFQAHFNPSLGRYVSSRQELDDGFKTISETASNATGIHHNFVAHDINDHQAFGLTDEHVEDGLETRAKANANNR